MNIVTIGSASQDIFIIYTHPAAMQLAHGHYTESYLLFKADAKISVQDIIYATGGGALNTAVAFTRLGATAYPWIAIGTDIAGQAILQALHQARISRALCHISTDRTGTSFIIPTPDYDRCILAFGGANELLGSDHATAQQAYTYMHNADVIYISSLHGKAASLLSTLVKQFAHKYIVLNPASSQLNTRTEWLGTLLSSVDIFILNAQEADLFMQHAPLRQKAKIAAPAKATSANSSVPHLLQPSVCLGPSNTTLTQYFTLTHSLGPRIVIVTNGAEGVYISDGTRIFFHPSIPVTVQSTVGAGDAFNATFVHFLTQYKSIEIALRAGILNAAHGIQHIGATTGLLTQDALEEQLNTIDVSLLKVF